MLSCLSFLNCIHFFHLKIIIDMPHQFIFIELFWRTYWRIFCCCVSRVQTILVVSPNTKKVVWNTKKHNQPSSFFLAGVGLPGPMWHIDLYCAHICPVTSSIDLPSIMIHAELLVRLVLHLCISKVLNPQMPPPLITMWWIYHFIVH